MDNDQLPEEEASVQAQGCMACHYPIVVPGYPNPLCSDCREKLIRYPIPLGIKIFGGVILVVMIVAVFGMSKNLSAGIHFERGKKALEDKRYFTAEKELVLVTEKIPAFLEAKEYLAIASFYNQDIVGFGHTIGELQGKIVKDQDRYAQITEMIERAAGYFPSDSFLSLTDRYHSTDSIPDHAFRAYLSQYPSEIFPATRYTNLLLERNNYLAGDSILNNIMQNDASNTDVLFLKTSVKRGLHQYDSAVYYCNRILSLNPESPYGMASMARTLLRQKKDTEAMQWAKKSIAIDGSDSYGLATLALACHFSNNPVERDRLLTQAKKDSTGAAQVQYVLDIMSGKEEFRD